MRTRIHCSDCGAAVNVKTHTVSFVDGGTEAQRTVAWSHAEHAWWNAASAAARECGYDDVVVCGRSGGWCAVLPTEHDDESPQFQQFVAKIELLMSEAPSMFSDALQSLLEDDANG